MPETAEWFLEGFLDDQSPTPRRTMIRPRPFRVGRRPRLELPLPFGSVSGRHAEIREQDGRLVVRDLGSKNGTWVNRQRVEGETVLQDGDVLHFGQVEFRLVREVMDADSLEQTMELTAAASQLPQRLVVGTREFQEMMEQRAVRAFFQPIVALPSGERVGYEILGRGAHEGLATSPYELFRIAAALGRESELSRLFRRTGVEAARDLTGTPLVFVNTHPAEMHDDDFLSSLTRMRELAPDMKLTVEVHEGAVAEPGRMRSLRDRLDELHIGLAYDDFGAGQARLLELVEVPPDMLKFDMSLIRGIDQAPAGKQHMVETLVHMARDLGIPCLAEGVEQDVEARTCTQLGFGYAQGYFFGRPSPEVN